MSRLDFDWNRARTLLATIDGGSLTAAARSLGSSQPTVGRHVQQLEEELGVVLFERTGTQLTPTPVAIELAEHVREMEAAAHRMALTASGQAHTLTGTVSISCSEGVSTFLLPRTICAIRKDHPGIRLRLVVTNDTSDLARREADIAVRNYRPRSPDLVAKRIRDSVAAFYATPAYLDRVGRPEHEQDTERLEFIAFEPVQAFQEGLQRLGLALTDEQCTLVCGHHLTHLALVKEHGGVAMLMEEIAAQEPVLERVPTLPTVPVPLWLTCRRELHTSRRVRVVFDALAAGLASEADLPSTPRG